MSEFLKVKTADEVLELLQQLPPLTSEKVPLDAACGRVLAAPMTAPEPVPHFDRATMDGYAVRARDTFGASETLPALLEIAGEISMGQATAAMVGVGKAAAVPTGGMLPAGADAVVMVEYTSALDEMTIEVTKPVAPGDNVLRTGEDIPARSDLFAAGWRLRPQDIGVLAALGIRTVDVYRQPRVAIVSTGDEVVPVATATLTAGKIRDINSYTLAGQVPRGGAVIGARQLVADDLPALVSTVRKVLEDHDVVLLSGGSSVGNRDFTLRILDEFADAELLVHGVAIRPGKPTILARLGGKLFWGLPGQPVSALMIAQAFVLPSLAFLQGEREPRGAGDFIRATLSCQVPSVHGRTDFLPVTLSRSGQTLLVTPVFGKSAMINILAKADGYIVIPEHVEGLDQATEVTVRLFS